MAQCNECIHFDVCKELDDNAHIVPRDWDDTELLIYEGAENCEFFKPKSRFVELPCAVGDTVYTNNSLSGFYLRAKNRPYPAEVVFIGLNEEYGFFNVDIMNLSCMLQFNFSDIGKTVFLTREAAENALKEMGMDGD